MKVSNKINVLYITSGADDVAGATSSLVNMLHGVSQYVNPIVLVQAEGRAADFIRQHGFRVIIYPYRNNFYNHPRWKRWILYVPRYLRDYWLDRRDIKNLCYLLRDEKIKIIHTNSSVVEIGAALAPKLGAKHIWHIREYMDLDFHFTPFGGINKLKRKIRKADGIIAISTPIAKHWRVYEHENARVIWDAVRPYSSNLDIEEKEKYILYCATSVSINKGADTAVEVFKESGLADKGYQLYIIGGCTREMRATLDKIYTKNITYWGFVSNVDSFIRKATALVMCSRNEGLGRITVEAMFCGCPIIARAAGGTLDFIKDGYNAYLFTTVQECVDKLMQVVETQPLDMMQRAHQFANCHFSERVYGEKIYDFYLDVVNKERQDG